MKMAGLIQKKRNLRRQIKHGHGCNLKYRGMYFSRLHNIRLLSFVLPLFIFSLFLTILMPASSSAHTLGNVPYWDGGAGADFAPELWPSENEWMAYTSERQTINDPRVNDPSNGGTRPQNYVNVSSGCPDKTKPSMYIHYANNTLYFRWRVEQIPNTFAIGPGPGVFSDVSPWKSGQWTVMMDTDGDGFREFGTQLDGSTGMPAYPGDIMRTVYSNTLSQNMDPHDRDIFELHHNPTGFVDRPTGIMLNFQGTNNATTSWPNGPAETFWDYGTTRAINITSSDIPNSCSAVNANEYYVDYQIPLGMLGNGTYDFDCTKPAGLFFSTANSLTNPFQKDVVAGSTAFVATPEACVPFGDPVILCGPDGPVIVPQPVVDWITSDTTTCNVGLTAMVRGAIVPNSCTPNIASVNFYYYFDANANGSPDDGSSWVLIGAGMISATDPTQWTINWNTIGSGLPRGQYLIGVEAVNVNGEHTWSYLTAAEVLVQKGTQPTHNANPYLPDPGSTVLVGKALLGGTCGETVVVDKTVNPNRTTIGQNVQFTVTVHNNTSNNLQVNSVTDYLPTVAGSSQQFTYVSTDGGTLTPGTPAVAGAMITWNFSPARTIAAGGTGTIIFTATAPDTEGTYQNTCGSNVNVVSWGLEEDIKCNYVEIAVGAPRLTIAKTADQTTRAAGENITYTIAYSNDSPANVTGAYITDVLPAGLTFVSAANGGAYDLSTRTIRWDIGSVLSGTGPFTVSFVASVTNPYPPTEPVKLKNTATIYSNETTPKQADVTVIVTGLSRPLLTIQKIGNKVFVDPTAATPNDRVAYTIAFSNVGNASATAATITDVVPTGWLYVSSVAGTNCPAGTTTGNPVTSVTWNLGNLAVNTTGTCNLILRANDTQSQPYVGDNPSTNTASIQAANFTPPVTSSFTVGLTGGTMTCPGQTYYFQNEFLDPPTNSMEIANTAPPGSGASAYHNVLLPTNGCPVYTPITGFYMDPVLANDGTLAPITNVWYHSKTNGNPMTVRVTMYDYDPDTGQKTQLGQGIVDDNGASQDPKAFSITLAPSQAPVAGDRLYMEYDACTSSNLQNLNIHFYYDGIYTTANKKLIPTPSHFCYQGYSVVMNKTVDKTTALPGDTLTYSITFGNNGGANVTGAQIIDTLPPGTTLISTGADRPSLNSTLLTSGTDFTCSGQVCTFNVRSSDQTSGQQITAGLQGSLVVKVTVDNPFPAGVYELINNSTLTTNETQPITSSARTVVTTDISILKSVDKTLLYPGDTATFTLKVINSSGAAISVDISDVLPTDTYFSYVGGSASNGGVYTGDTPASHTLNWTALSVPANSSLSVAFQMAVSLTGVPIGTTYKDNTGVVSYGSQQYSNTVTVVILNSPNINITKSASPAGPVAAGDTITWSMSVTNNGPQSALGVIVTDPIIPYTKYKAGSLVYQVNPNPLLGQTDADDQPADTSYFDAVKNRTVFEVGTLPGGATRTMSFRAVVDRPMPSGTTNLTNTATVASSNTITKQASASIDVTDAPAFVLNKYTASLVASGQNVTFTIYYKNTGGATATSVVVTDTLAAGLTFVSADNGGTYSAGVVTWNLGSLPPDAEGVLHLTVTPAACGTYNNTATITSTVIPGGVVSNGGTPTATVVCGLTPDKSTTTPIVTNTSTGTQATYILTVNNPTATTAAGIMITDNFPEGFTFDSSAPVIIGGTGYNRTSVVNPADGANHPAWGTFDINAGGSVTIQFGTRVAYSVPEGTYDNNVTATGLNKSVLLFDELATAADDVRVVVPVDLSVTKTVDSSAPHTSNNITYTILLTNVGQNHAFSVNLTDLLPSQVSYVTHTVSQGSYNHTTGIWTVGRVDRNASATMTITVYPNDGTAGTSIQNCATITSSIPRDPNLPKTSCVTITPTLVSLTDFEIYTEEGKVVVEWETASELKTIGFYLYRLDRDLQEFVKVNEDLLPGLLTSPDGGYYRYVDQAGRPSGIQTYQLEEVQSDGSTILYGPYSADLGNSKTAKVLKQMSSDGVINITIKGDVSVTTRSKAAVSDSGFEFVTDSFSSQSRGVSAEKSQRLAAAKQAQKNTSLRKQDRKGAAIKISVYENGIYYVDASDISMKLNMPLQQVKNLIKNGLFSVTSLDGQTSYTPEKDNAGLYFYGKAINSQYTDENIYWLSSAKGLKMGSLDGSKAHFTGNENDSFIDTAHGELDLIALPASVNDPSDNYWYWGYVVAGNRSFEKKSYTFQAHPAVSGQPHTASLTVRLQGGSNTNTNPDQHAVVSLNGRVVGEGKWDGLASYTLSANFDQALIKEGENIIEVKAVLDKGVPYSVFYIDAFDVSYSRSFKASGDILSFNAAGSPNITVEDFSVPGISVYDITNPLAPLAVTSTSIKGQAGNYTVKFSPASASSSYIAVASTAVNEPDTIADLVSSLKNKDNAADYLVITPEEFKDTAALLASYRQSKGMKVMTVYLEDIMDEFNSGIFDPNAIKSFLQYTYSSWRRTPAYAVLVGEGTYDYKDSMGYGGNMVPPVMVSTPMGLMPSDNVLGDVNGDNVPEIAIGRFPVLSATELSAMLDKIKSFEATKSDGIILLADAAGGAGNFPKESDDISQLFMGHTIERIYLSDYKIAQARSLFFEGLNKGFEFVNYIGHASYAQLSQSGLLKTSDVSGLSNTVYPIMTMLTCAAGNFSVPGADSLAESLAIKSGGGIVSSWSPTGYSLDADAHMLGAGFYSAVLQSDALTVADAVAKSMAAYRDKGRLTFMMNIFNILGDPALRLR